MWQLFVRDQDERSLKDLAFLAILMFGTGYVIHGIAQLVGRVDSLDDNSEDES